MNVVNVAQLVELIINNLLCSLRTEKNRVASIISHYMKLGNLIIKPFYCTCLLFNKGKISNGFVASECLFAADPAPGRIILVRV